MSIDKQPEMRAWTHNQRGVPPANLTLKSIPRPTPESLSHNEVLVKVTHAALNPSATFLTALIPNPRGTTRIPELEFSGVVVAAGKHVRAELQGSSPQVFGVLSSTAAEMAILRNDRGALAEYVVTYEDYVTLKPENMSIAHASALSGAGLTAINFLDHAHLKKGDLVLINGGSGGVGTFTVQLAKHLVGIEGTVVAVCSQKNVDMVKSLGADEVVAYDQIPVHEYLSIAYSKRKFDAIIDTIGVQDLYTHCPAYLVDGAPYLNCGVQLPKGMTWGLRSLLSLLTMLLPNFVQPRILGGIPRQFRILNTIPDRVLAERMKKLVADGVIKVVVDSVWKMEDVPLAYEILQKQRAKGKLIIEVQPI